MQCFEKEDNIKFDDFVCMFYGETEEDIKYWKQQYPSLGDFFRLIVEVGHSIEAKLLKTKFFGIRNTNLKKEI